MLERCYRMNCTCCEEHNFCVSMLCSGGVNVVMSMSCVFCRPVDCYTKVPLDYLPGFINETIYTDNIESGWAWYPYLQNNKQLTVSCPSFT